jgi:membrane associated rhomboid family serine protease
MSQIKEDVLRFFRDGDALSRLIAYLLGSFVLILVLRILSQFSMMPVYGTLMPYFTLPADLSELLFKPWTLFSYMFVHEDFTHILFNLLYLYFAGQLFQSYLGADKLWSTFILGGLSGGLLYVLAYNLFPFFSDQLALATNRGASAGIMAILVSTAVIAPHFPVRLFFVLEVKMWQVAALLILLDLAYMPTSNQGGHIAHIGGALFGFIMARKWRDQRIFIGAFMNDWIERIKDALKGRSRLKVAHSRRADKGRGASSKSPNNKADQERLDAILDKISKGGYESLSKEEKDFLFRMSDR